MASFSKGEIYAWRFFKRLREDFYMLSKMIQPRKTSLFRGDIAKIGCNLELNFIETAACFYLFYVLLLPVLLS
jgi:hypothetical protein